MYFILIIAIRNKIDVLISFLDSSLFIYVNATKFSILVLYSATLLGYFY